MGFQDVLKKSFLEGFAGTDLSATTIVLSLVALAVITAAIILTIQSSVVISLGMVGALSIVRFRTAIKEPQDLVFLFWAISTGIICGAGLFEVAVITAILVTVVLLVLELVPVRSESMLLIVNAEDCEVEEALMKAVSSHTKRSHVRSRNINVSGCDKIVELRVKDGGRLVKEVAALKGIRNVSHLSHDGEVTY